MVPKRVTLKALRERERRDLGLPILCFLFVVSRFLDVYSLINVYRIIDREVFNPLNHPLIQLVLGLPVEWIGNYDFSPMTMAVIYRFGAFGFVIWQAILTAVMLGIIFCLWRTVRRYEVRWGRFMLKALLYLLTLGSVGGAFLNLLSKYLTAS